MATKTIEIKEGCLVDIRTDAGSLLVDHFCEVGRDAGVRNLDPDWATLERLEDAERLYVLIAYQESECVGYCVSMLMQHTNNRTQVQLVNDAMFIHPSVRKNGVGLEMIRCMEGIASELAADCVWYAPTHSRLDQILACRDDYQGTHTVYSRKAQ